MKVLFVGENIKRSKGGIVTVMKLILSNSFLLKRVSFIPVYSSGDGFNLLNKIFSWLRAIILFSYYIPKVDLVHFHHAIGKNLDITFYLAKFALFLNKKVLLHNHAADFNVYFENLSPKKKKKIIRNFEKVNASIVLSRSWYKWYKSIAPEAKWILLPNAIKIHDSKKELHKDIINLLYMSRLEKRKGFWDLINVLPRIKKDASYHLYIAGNGDINLLNEKIKEFNLENRITFLGYVNQEEKIALLEKCDIFLLPSYNEGLPMALLEAMSFGLVPITTPVGGIPELVINMQNGILVKQGNSEELVKALNVCISDNILRLKLSKAARNTVSQNYNMDKYARKLYEIYKNI